MATTTIPWGDGSGDNIYLTYPSASGNQTVQVSSDANTGAARSKVVTFSAGNISRQLTVEQEAGLPYTPLEYIQTDGIAYIDTGVPGNVIRAFKGKVKLNLTITNSEIIVGCGNTDGANSTFAGAYRSNNYTNNLGYAYYYFYASSNTADITDALPNEFEFRSILRNGTLSIGIKKPTDTDFTNVTRSSSRNVSTNKAMYIFAGNYNNAPVRKMASGERLYYLRIYNNVSFSENNNGLLFDGVPALYKGEYGLWDKVSDSFFGNAADSGAFTGQ